MMFWKTTSLALLAAAMLGVSAAGATVDGENMKHFAVAEEFGGMRPTTAGIAVGTDWVVLPLRETTNGRSGTDRLIDGSDHGIRSGADNPVMVAEKNSNERKRRSMKEWYVAGTDRI